MERAHAARQHRTRRARARPATHLVAWAAHPAFLSPRPLIHRNRCQPASFLERRFSLRPSPLRRPLCLCLSFALPQSINAHGRWRGVVPGIAYNQAAADPPPRMTQRVRASVSYACAAQLPHAESDRARLHHLSWQGRAHLALISITRQSPWRRRRRPWRPSARPHWSRRGSSHQSCPGRGPPLGR